MNKIQDYKILKTIQVNGENADVFLVENSQKQKFILKQFNKAVKPNLDYAKYNHFGRRRDGSTLVFNEIKKVSNEYSFLTTFYDRFKWNNKWCITIEYFDGITFYNFLRREKILESKIVKAVEEFAKEVSTWHNNNFALGDAHLGNVLINTKTYKVKLVDYSQIHNPDFKYCKKYKCFEPNNKRLKEDLINNSGKLGQGFIRELDKACSELDIKINLTKVFIEEYNMLMQLHN